MNEIVMAGTTKDYSHGPGEIRASKKCPTCGLRVFDKITVASGIVEVKCHRCGTLYYLNLAFRSAARQSSYSSYYHSSVR